MTESSKQRPHREFWIADTERYGCMNCGGLICGEDPKDSVGYEGHTLHVIEASYAKELEADIEWRKEAYSKLDDINIELNHKLAVAIKALEFYSKWDWTDEFVQPIHKHAREALEQIKQMKAG